MIYRPVKRIPVRESGTWGTPAGGLDACPQHGLGSTRSTGTPQLGDRGPLRTAPRGPGRARRRSGRDGRTTSFPFGAPAPRPDSCTTGFLYDLLPLRGAGATTGFLYVPLPLRGAGATPGFLYVPLPRRVPHPTRVRPFGAHPRRRCGKRESALTSNRPAGTRPWRSHDATQPCPFGAPAPGHGDQTMLRAPTPSGRRSSAATIIHPYARPPLRGCAGRSCAGRESDPPFRR